MKKYLVGLGLCIFIAACAGNQDQDAEQDQGSNISADAQQSNVDTNAGKIGTGAEGSMHKGEALIKASDCTTCHTPEVNILGPSYKEIAAKYELNDKNIELLITKIIEGGSGNWGQIPMTPHPKLSRDDAREMVHYILSLK